MNPSKKILILNANKTSKKPTEMTTLREDFNRLIEKIAKDNIVGLETLETRNSDDMDFHDVSVWCLKKALEDAFIAGMTVGNTIKN